LTDDLNIPLRQDIKFDIILLDSVLHHVVERTRGKSTALIKKIIEILVDKLSANGILIVKEWYCSIYIYIYHLYIHIVYSILWLKTD
jgi:hypothetical protein